MRGIPAAPAKSAADHPRTHALSIAAATHLNKSGHLSNVDKARIHARSKANLKRLKGHAKEPAAFGSLAPDMDGDGE